MTAASLAELIGSGISGGWIGPSDLRALIFVLASLLTYIWRYGYKELLGRWTYLPIEGQALLAAAGILMVLSLSRISQRLARVLLLICAGVRGWPDPLRDWRTNRWKKHRDRILKRWGNLSSQGDSWKLNPSDRREFIRLDVELTRELPLGPEMMPTRLGNILLAAEDYPRHRYGLDPLVCWPHLRLLIPEEVRRRVEEGEKRILGAMEWIGWSLALFVWALWLQAFLVCIGMILAIFFLYQEAIREARNYREDLGAVFDIFRHRLYEALHWPIPKPEDEKASGQRLTIYLWRGTPPPSPTQDDSIETRGSE